MKAHVGPKSRECPFCGASTYEVMSGTGVKCIRCTNKRTCGAIVSLTTRAVMNAVFRRWCTSFGGQERSE